MKTQRRDLLNPIRQPQGLAATVNNLATRTQRIERAPVKIILQPPPPIKAPKPDPKPIEQLVIGCIETLEKCFFDGGTVTIDIETDTGTFNLTVPQTERLDSSLLFWAAHHQDGSAPDQPTVSSIPELTWTLVETVTYDDNRLSVWRSSQVVQDVLDSGIAITIDFAANQQGAVVRCSQLVGAEANPVVQSASFDNVAMTSPFAVTLDDPITDGNYVFSVAATYSPTSDDLGNDVAYTEDHDIYGSDKTSMAATDDQIDPTDGGEDGLSWAYGGGTPAAVIGIEIRACPE